MGEDGEAPWTGKEGAAQVSKKLKVPVSESVVSKWLKKEISNRRHAENYETMLATTMEFVAERAESTLDITDLVDGQIVMMISRIHNEDGSEEAIKATAAFTKLKQAITADQLLKQRVREYDESVEKLKARIDALCAALKKSGGSEDQIDKFNLAAVQAVDEQLGRGGLKA